jgi:hypothetical protein
LRAWLSQAEFSAICAYAGENKRVLSFLTALTYDQDLTFSWRAVEALGLAASRIAEVDPEFVRVHLRRLVWLLNDESGGIGWHAPEAIGEIIYHHPDLFKEFIPILVNLMDMEPEDAIRFRAGWLWAIGRLALVRPDEVRSALPWIIPCLEDPDPQIRGMSIWCLGELADEALTEQLLSLKSDPGLMKLYYSPDLVAVRIGDMVNKLLYKLKP